jgi:hypothetical protein
MDAKRYIGRVTAGATIGTAITGSLTVIIGYILSQYGITLPAGVSDAVFILLSSLGALIGGRQSPSDKVTFEGMMEAAARGVTGVDPKDNVATGVTEYPAAPVSNFEIPRETYAPKHAENSEG